MSSLIIHGHKPDKLGGWNAPPDICNEIKGHIREYLKKETPDEVLLGLDLGVSQWSAEICKELGIPYTAYIPFTDFSNKWPPPTRAKYLDLTAAAKTVVVVTKGPYEPGVYYRRNNMMAAMCDKAAFVWDGSDGVTNHLRQRVELVRETVVAAKQIPVCNLYNLFGPDLIKKIESAKKASESYQQKKPVSTASASATVKSIVAKTSKSTKKAPVSPPQEEDTGEIEILAPKRYIELD